MKTPSKEKSDLLRLAERIEADMQEKLPQLHPESRSNQARVVATLLQLRESNTVLIANALPFATERLDMRYQRFKRILDFHALDLAHLMAPWGKELLQQLCRKGNRPVLSIDQSSAGSHDVLMLAVRVGRRALPLLWKAFAFRTNPGFDEVRQLLEAVMPWMPPGTQPLLLGDRFYGSAALIGWLESRHWEYRLRLRDSLQVVVQGRARKTGDLEVGSYSRVLLTEAEVETSLEVIHDGPLHAQAWVVAMNGRQPSEARGRDYGMRWSIEALFSDFKTRGYGIDKTQVRLERRLEMLLFLMTLGLYWATSTGMWELEKKGTGSGETSPGAEDKA